MLTFNYLKNNTKFKVLFGQKFKKNQQQKTKQKQNAEVIYCPKAILKINNINSKNI